MPRPIPNFRHVLTIVPDVGTVRDKLVLQFPLDAHAAITQLRQAVDGVNREVKPIHIVQHRHVERCGDGALFLVAANVQIQVVPPAVRQPMNEPRVAVVREDDRRIRCKQRVELGVR